MSEQPSSPHEHLGSILLDQGRFADAEKHFRNALAENPNDPFMLAQLGLCELRQGRAKPARETFDRAIALAPESAHLHALKAFSLVELRKPADALRAADAALAIDPECDDAFVARAAAHLARNEWAKAEADARQALDLNPEHEGAANQLAHALRLQNRLGESQEQIAYMLSENPEDSDTHVAAGWTALQRGDRTKAEEHFLEALRLEPDSETARDGLKEAFRAKSPFYRAYLRYCFFMARFTEGRQWMLIIGLFVLIRFARMILGPAAALVIGAYLLFVLWVHVARPVGNFQMLFDRVARHALTRGETWEAWLSGGGVLLGFCALLAGFFAGLAPVFILGITLIAAAFPFAYTFTNATVGKWLFGAIGLFVVLAGALKVAAPALGIDGSRQLPAGLFGVAILAVIVTTWICNISAISRRQ